MIYPEPHGNPDLHLYLNDIVEFCISYIHDCFPVNNVSQGTAQECTHVFFNNEKIKKFLIDNNLKVYGLGFCDESFFDGYNISGKTSDYNLSSFGDRPVYNFYNILEIVDSSDFPKGNSISKYPECCIVFDTKEQLCKFKLLYC